MDTSGPRSSGTRGARSRLLVVIPAAVLMLLGLNAGLLLLGLPAPIVTDRLADLHSILLVFGFVGTLISLERAVALRAAWANAAPALLVIGTLLALGPLPLAVGGLLITAGAAAHVAQYAAIWRRQPMTATAVQALGSLSGLVAALAWTGGVPPARLVPLLAVFLILTIAGERLELARVAGPGPRAERMLFALALALSTAALVTLTAPAAVPVAGLLLLALVAWLLRYDIARVTVRHTGLARYVAVCLLAGYAWLALAGAGWLLGGARSEGPIYDATTHAVFLGFVITMIMAHAPLILPAVLRVSIPYHPALYVPVALLQLALLVRVVAGDAWGWTVALQVGGAGAAVAMVLFGLTAVAVSLRARRGVARTERSRTDVAA